MVIDIKNIVEFKVIGEVKKGVHWFWWLFWLIIFFPVLALVLLVHLNSSKVYTVMVKNYKGDVERLDNITEKELMSIRSVCF